ncbi:mediator of RNA polymerase II transcription subunit 8 isoform X2 [Telopea speciosissima]|uniref:mediator of RNA polymerase II transcription subunit 8 isoform X2 n=1 Tax=Telopea speciosissima TaxID=54955 RepID=UPI001CC589C9|nr:mediator of RNA polymerase II transcription subunit 8 isoform X2 [Telopea speciosissima]
MASMEGVMGAQDQTQVQQQPRVEKLNLAVQQQLNLESVKTRAIGLYKAISRILEDFDAIARTNAIPKWQDILGQFSMVNLELFNIVEDIKKVSKAFVVHPRNVNAENATILPVMLSSKLLPEMEAEDSTKREQLLIGMQNLPISAQIEKLKTRIDMIGAACESAEKVIADARKAYGLGTRQAPTIVPTLDKVQAAKIQEQENSLRAAANFGEGLRLPGEQRHIPSSLPMHLVDVLPAGDGAHITDTSGMYPKNAPSNSINSQGTIPQSLGRSVPSPSAATGATSFDNTTTSPLPYANSPRSGTNMMNTPSPQQQAQVAQQQQQQQQQRQKIMQLLPHQQQLLAQQQFRQSPTPGLGQVHGQHQMQFSQPLAHQQFQNRQLQSGHVQHSIGQSQLNQGNQLRTHLSQFTGTANSTLFNTAQTSPNSQMISNISATMSSQSHLPRVQFGLSGGHAQRSHASQILNDPMFNMGVGNPSNMMPMQQQQQQQHGVQSGFGNMPGNAQNLQPGSVALQNASQNPNFQQRQQGQQ